MSKPSGKTRERLLTFLFCLIHLTLFLSVPTIARAQLVNLSFTGDSGWKSTTIIPNQSSAYTYPDGVIRPTANFVFKAGANSVWKLNAGASVICRQEYPYGRNQFLIGSGDGTPSSLTFTTDTLLNPGKLCARGDNSASFRIGEQATGSSGKLRLDGGVRIQTGLIYGEGPSPAIDITNGRLDVFTGNALKRLNGISVSLGPKGNLWVEDPSGIIKSAATFSTFCSGASILSPGGTLNFKNSVEGYPMLGWAGVLGTLISVDSSLDSDADGLPDSWESANQLDASDNGSISLNNGPVGDPDSDGSSNLAEYHNGTNPRLADTDGDGLADGVETNTHVMISASDTGSDPRNSDTDRDTVTDGREMLQGSNPNDIDDPGYDADRDKDGLPNEWEIARNLNPDDDGSIYFINGANGDPDNDGLTNSEEYRLDSDPRFNESGFAWQPMPAKAGVLVVFAHPDDEGIAFGGVMTYYQKVKNVPTVLLSMTSGDYNTAPAVREQQLRNAAWAYGLRTQPIFARFRDYPVDANGTWDLWADGVLDGDDIAAGRLKAAMYVAKTIRTYRPEVIATHGIGGEYGHNDHIATCLAVIDAWILAADPAIEIDGLPAWQPKKLYLHEWGQNRLFHDFWETAYPILNGKTPREITIAGLQYHYNQSQVSTAYLTGEVGPSMEGHPSEWWELYATTVGYDTVASDFTVAGTAYNGWAKGDFLEHVTLSTNAPPLITLPTSLDTSYPWNAKLPAQVTDESPLAALNLSWTQVSGPGTVAFTPSAQIRNPMTTFSAPGSYVLRLTANDGSLTSTREVEVNALPRSSTVVHAINCGGPAFTSADGTQWRSDQGFSGGTSISYASLPIAGTADDVLFQKQRSGSSFYTLPISNGNYLVTLRFAEGREILPAQRRFHVNIEGQRRTTSLDPCLTSGFARAFDRSYSVTVSDGSLDLQFASEINQPMIAAILVTNTVDSPPPPPGLPTDGPFALQLIAPNLDTDGDGVSDRLEFITGTSITTPEPSNLELLPDSNGVRFLTRVAAGSDYAGFVRRYRVEKSTSLTQGAWSTVWTGEANGQWKVIPIARDGPKGFFRLVTWLQAVP